MDPTSFVYPLVFFICFLLALIPSILLWFLFPKQEIALYFEKLAKSKHNNFEIKFIDNKKGRGIIANRSFNRGERIFAESPFVCCTKGQIDPHIRTCGYCLKPLFKDTVPPSEIKGDIVCCRQNCSVLYCSTVCRDDAWERYHRGLCTSSFQDEKTRQSLIKFHHYLASHTDNPYLLLTAKIFAVVQQRLAEGMTVEESLIPIKFMTGFGYWKTLKGKVPNLSEVLIQKFKSDMQFFQSSPLYNPKYGYLMTDLSRYTSIQMTIWFNAFGFSVVRDGMSIQGSCIAKAATFLNHSCQPNTAWRYNSGMRKLEFVALRQINKGDEITISYIPDLSLSSDERRSLLEQRFRFFCECPRCLSDHLSKRKQD
eukprot:TRINITY_DN2211_c0_g1_i3.p1 TRINITY_DN2211_c0_g1~~TRINITY_DN2211_c0_g1_i3.p1  ORF type:complete len:368 (+),score=25.99 TRINITY_DN2211_c0_g1_i3:119-1222(+)